MFLFLPTLLIPSLFSERSPPVCLIFPGIALLVGALVQHDTLVLYHHRVVYNTVSFTEQDPSIKFYMYLSYTSNRVFVYTSSVVLFESKGGPLLYHLFLLTVYGTLYFCFIIVFGLQLQHWGDEIAGHCYSTLNITFSLALHPKADMVYLGLTSLYWCVTIWYTTRAALSNLALIVDNHSIKSPVDQAQHD